MEEIFVVDFGGQYAHLISRKLEKLGVNSRIISPDKNIDASNAKGIILSGGALSVFQKDAPSLDTSIFNLNIPILGICYGHQLLAKLLGGKVERGKSGEYGPTKLRIIENDLFKNLNETESVWMNHKDVVVSLPLDFKIIASTDSSKIAAFENKSKKMWGVQFHPEVSHTEKGFQIIKNFVKMTGVKINGIRMSQKEKITNEIKKKLQGKKAIIGLSGGIDSSVASILVNDVIKNDLIAVYVDTGLMRKNETEFIRSFFSDKLNLKIVNAKELFFKNLKSVTDPERKRKIIGKTFIDVFNKVAKEEKIDTLIQGTIYSDRIESGKTKYASNIKSHHNVGGLPKSLPFEIYEPLRELYKDEVRELAKEVGFPKSFLERQVFPGPGLAIRVLGEVTPQKIETVRHANYIVECEMKRAEIFNKVWMSFAVLLPIKSVGVKGDSRSYQNVIAIRIVESLDAMTANFSKIPYSILDKMSTRITNELENINRVVYDISNKPPATMEWE